MKRSALKLLSILLFASACPLALLAQQPVNILTIAGATPSTSNGTSNSGDLRVNIASDNTAFQVKLLGNSGAIFDAAQNAAAPANELLEGGTYNSTLPTITTGNSSQIQLDAKGQQLMDLNYVNGAAVATGNGTNGGAIRVAIASDNTAFAVNATLQAGSATVGKVDLLGNAGAIMDFAGQNAASPANSLQIGGQFNTTPTTLATGDSSPLQLNSAGQLLVACSGCSAASTVSLVPETTGGVSAKHFVAAASDNATNLKSSAGQIYSLDGYNNAAYPVYFKLYNSASSPTGCGATNLFKVVGLQAGTQHTLTSEEGYAMGTGIGYCLTKGIADSDDTAVLLSDATVDIGYK
jgi:hypothetical protein